MFLISGPCVLESDDICLRIGRHLRRVWSDLGLLYVFKASYDKANRSSGKSYRGPGLQEGLARLAEIRRRLEVPVLTDVHSVEEAVAAADVCDVLQIPAFLCRQTDLI
ncbi:MAG: 3-deoxy-8-phosphooctulonate synthase, partial [Verrucomicrobiales bacterium]|nr:3-deoxy-8-phosphooctulonate synthase [Verrucomicrobiales bacterium]